MVPSTVPREGWTAWSRSPSLSSIIQGKEFVTGDVSGLTGWFHQLSPERDGQRGRGHRLCHPSYKEKNL